MFTLDVHTRRNLIDEKTPTSLRPIVRRGVYVSTSYGIAPAKAPRNRDRKSAAERVPRSGPLTDGRRAAADCDFGTVAGASKDTQPAVHSPHPTWPPVRV